MEKPKTAAGVSAVEGGCATDESRDRGGVISAAVHFVLQVSIEWLVRLTGRKIRREEAQWLACVFGEEGLSGASVYQELGREAKEKVEMAPEAGLIPDFAVLRGPRFDPDAGAPHILPFYQ